MIHCRYNTSEPCENHITSRRRTCFECVFDKIRAEIEQKCCITVRSENEPAITLYDVFQIIDKYKAESEEV